MVVDCGVPACGSWRRSNRTRPSITITGPGAITASRARTLHALPSLEPTVTPAPAAQPSSRGAHFLAWRIEKGAGAGAYQWSYHLKFSPGCQRASGRGRR